MTQRKKKADQAGGEHEVYETPAWCVRRLLEAVTLPAGRWLEPCAASGNIVRAVNAHRQGARQVIWSMADIREEVRDDLRILGDVKICDFLEESWREPCRRWAFDVAITNPPFSLAAQFIAKCRDHAPLVAMLLPVPFYGSAGREAFFDEHTPEAILQLPDRPQFTGSGSNSLEYGWWIWGPLRYRREGLKLQRLAVTPLEERKAA